MNGYITLFTVTGLPPVIWHVHEIIFGFAATCALGFLLTAVQNWTGLRSAYGTPLILLVTLWLCARVAMWNHQLLLAVLFQSLWWLGCVWIVSRCLIKARSRRNYQFVPLLLVLASFNISILVLSNQGNFELVLHLAHSSILVFGILVSIIGGRVIPLFTRNATRSRAIKSSRWLDISILVLGISGALAYLLGQFINLPVTPAPLMLAAGVLHLVRLYGWDSFSTLTNSLLWSLHATYFCLGIGLILLGLSYSIEVIRFSDALHLIAVGTIGGMILAMISRVSLGHTGRPLVANSAMTWAFVLVLFAAGIRSLLPMLGWQTFSWNFSAALWCLAFALFVINYSPMLLKERRHT